MINDDDEKYSYFAVKSKLELYSSEWLRSKKKSIINEDNCFQNAFNDSSDYQRTKKDPQRISKLKSYINQKDIINLINLQNMKEYVRIMIPVV